MTVRLENTGIYGIYNPKALSCGTWVKQGCYWGHEVYKFHWSLCFEGAFTEPELWTGLRTHSFFMLFGFWLVPFSVTLIISPIRLFFSERHIYLNNRWMRIYYIPTFWKVALSVRHWRSYRKSIWADQYIQWRRRGQPQVSDYLECDVLSYDSKA